MENIKLINYKKSFELAHIFWGDLEPQGLYEVQARIYRAVLKPKATPKSIEFALSLNHILKLIHDSNDICDTIYFTLKRESDFCKFTLDTIGMNYETETYFYDETVSFECSIYDAWRFIKTASLYALKLA